MYQQFIELVLVENSYALVSDCITSKNYDSISYNIPLKKFDIINYVTLEDM